MMLGISHLSHLLALALWGRRPCQRLMLHSSSSAFIQRLLNPPSWVCLWLPVDKLESLPMGPYHLACTVASDFLRPHGLQHSRVTFHHQLLELAQIHIHRVGDAIQPSHPLSSPSPPALNLSQGQGLFQRVSSSHQVANVLKRQYQSFQLALV